MKKIFLATLLCAAAGAAQAGGNVAAGKAVYEKLQCASCHGTDAKTSADPMYPKLAGQHADYLEVALREYQRGAQNPTTKATLRKNAIMQGFATQLSAKDVGDVAAYLSSLPSDLATR
jgi:cytochrome c553